MSLIRSHDCLKCGAALLFDDEEQVYICPYCDRTYQYDYFNEDKLLTFAYEKLDEKEFGTARESLEFLCKKSSPGFPALCGLWLARSEISSVSSLSIESHHLTERGDALTPYLEKTEGPGKAYFQHIKEAGDLYDEYRDTIKNIQKIESQQADLDDRIMRYNMKLEARKQWVSRTLIWFGNGSEASSYTLVAAVLLFAFLTVAGYYIYDYFGLFYLCLVYGSLLVLPFLIYFLQKSIKIRRLLKKIFPLVEERSALEKTKNELKEHEFEVSRAYYNKLQSAKNLEPDEYRKK